VDQWTISFEVVGDHTLHQLWVAKEKAIRYSAYKERETSLIGSYRVGYLSGA
jgi:hypothetical protein